MSEASLGLLSAAITDLAARLEELEARLPDATQTRASERGIESRLRDIDATLAELRAGLNRLTRARAARDSHAEDRRPWHELDSDQAERRWLQLHGWVSWLVTANNIGPKEIPDCWYLHTGLVDELQTLRWAWIDTSSGDAKMTEPIWWREALHRARTRWPSFNPNGCSTTHSPTRDRTLPNHRDWHAFLAEELADRPADQLDDAS